VHRPFVVYVLLVAASFVGGSVSADPIRLSVPVETGPGFEVFGAVMPDHGEALGLAALIENEALYLGKKVKVRARIADVCQKKGCFLLATDGNYQARVTFKDYGFFVPTDSSGDRVTLLGVFKREILSAKKAAHFAEDLGLVGEAPVATRHEYQIVAESALIRAQ